MTRVRFIFGLLVFARLTPALAQSKWERMDYGPFLSSSVTMPDATNGEDVAGITLKGITIKLGANASVCFDTDLLRYTGGWTGGWLSLYGTPFDGTHRPPEKSRPAVKGTLQFRTKLGPGCANRDQHFNDPRREPFGPLPESWAKWRGLYVNGDRVVLSYQIEDVWVLELPGFETSDGLPIFTRTFRLGPTTHQMTLAVSEIDPGRKTTFPGADATLAPELDKISPGRRQFGYVGDNVAAMLDAPGGIQLLSYVGSPRLLLAIPPQKTATLFKLALTSVPTNKTSAHLAALLRPLTTPIEDPESFTKGGPARYSQTIITRGALGNSGAPYEVDTLTLPEENPWNSWMRPTGFDLFSDGQRAAVCTWSGDVWIVSGIDDRLEKLTWRRFATGLFQPLGLKIVDDVIYVLGRDQIARLRDLNGDGEADFYENFNNDVTVTANFHEFAMDLHTDPEGNFYFTKGAPLLGTDLWDRVAEHNGCVLKVSRSGSHLERFATGLRAPNGASVGPNGEVTCSDNEGIWTPVCRLNWVKPGGFYGAVGMHHTSVTPTNYDAPLCWLPFNVDNSAGGQVWVTSTNWGPFQGELLHTSYGKCALFQVLKEEVQGVMQGGVVKFPLKFDSGIMRGRFNLRDGQLYVAGMKGWQTSAVRDGALYRVRYTGKPVRAVRALHVTRQGLDLTFTTPVDPASAMDLQNYNLQQWNYKWSKDYGSDLYSVADPTKVIGKKGELRGDPVTVHSVRVSPDKLSVSLVIPGVRPVMQMMIKFNLKTAEGEPLSFEIYNTINRVKG